MGMFIQINKMTYNNKKKLICAGSELLLNISLAGSV